MSQAVRLEIDGASVTWRVTHAVRRYALHSSHALQIVAVALDAEGQRAPVEAGALVAKGARVVWSLASGHEATFEGVVEHVEEIATRYSMEIVPRVALLSEAVDHQVFLAKDAVEIAEEVLGEHGVRVDSRVVRALPKRAQCVQSFESDLAFVARVLAEEGIVWRVGEKDALILTDDSAAFVDVATLPVRETGGLVTGESVSRLRLAQAAVQERTLLREYDFAAPLVDLTADAGPIRSALERYEYPGGYRDPATGKALAKIRLEEARARRVVLSGESNCDRLVPGTVLTLEGAARAEINARWLLLDVTHDWRHEGSSEPRCVVQFVAVRADDAYRPPRVEAQGSGGVQTGTVTGPSGAEIHTEAFGQVRLLHRWDRRRPKTDASSAWMRVIQPPTSGGFFLPRVGWEALVGFAGGSGDRPIVMGRLYNGEAPPPNSLPGKRVVTAFGTLTTPGGGSGNLLAMDDSAGNEGMAFNASKNMNERTEKDKVTSIAAADTHSVGANRTLIVGQVHQTDVAGAQTYSIGASRTVNVDANKGISAASESVSIGGLRSFTIGGDYGTTCSGLMRLVGGAKVETAIEHQTRSVQGASMVMVGATWKVAAGAHAAVSVSGASLETVAGAKSVTTGKYALQVRGALNQTLASRKVASGSDHIESFGAAASYSIAGSAKLKGANVIVKAADKLTIKAGGLTIELTPGAITIDGKFDGAAASVDSGDEKYE